jgi:hypothetical protein
MIVIATQSMACDHGSVATDDAIDCTDEQAQHLLGAGLARLPDDDDGEPTPKQLRRALKWPSDPVPVSDVVPVEPGTDGAQIPDAVVETTKPTKLSRKKVKDATTNAAADPAVS